MNLPRKKVVSELLEFCLKGSTLLVGEPGIGKSWTLKAVKSLAKLQGLSSLYIPIDSVFAETETEFGAFLGNPKEDLITSLRNMQKQGSQPGILLFDAFDSARSDGKRNLFLRLIRRALIELKPDWNVCVSVRTFDADKSPELAQLFKIDQNSTRPRRTEIPALTNDDLNEAFAVDDRLSSAYSRCSSNLQGIFANPFNLWLLEQISHSNNDADFSGIRTATELLHLFWRYRVQESPTADENEFVLRNIARDQVTNKRLVSRKQAVYSPDIDESWRALFSASLLVDDTESKEGIKFSHNILFDYAVSKLLIPDEALDLADFLRQDPTRHLFLRPSLLYHFEDQFHYKNEQFWKNFFSGCGSRNAVLTPITQLILPTVLVSETSRLSDCQPLLTLLAEGGDGAVEGIVFLLRAIRALTDDWERISVERASYWGELLAYLADHLDRNFLWDLAFINNKLIGISGTNRNLQSSCGKVARSLFEYSVKANSPGKWEYGVASIWAIPQICSTYATDPNCSRKMLEEILGLLKLTSFPVNCISALCQGIEHVIPHDSDLVKKVYISIFDFTEESVETTQMGTPVMGMFSNRRQDYEMCQYNLLELYPKFLAQAPLDGIEGGIEALQRWILLNHIKPHLREGITLESLPVKFLFRGAEAAYIEDLSHIWSGGSYQDQEVRIAQELSNYLSRLAEEREGEPFEKALSSYSRAAKCAFLWSTLLEVGAQHPEIFAKYLLDLCTSITVLTHTDTSNAASAFIRAAIPFWAPEQIAQIEAAIMTLPFQEVAEEAARNFLFRLRIRLLKNFPSSALSTEALEIRLSEVEPTKFAPVGSDESSDVEEGWHKIGMDESLEIQGVDTSSPENRETLNLSNKIAEILSLDRSKLKQEDMALLVPIMRALRRELQANDAIHDMVRLRGFTELSSAAKCILRSDFTLDDDIFAFASEIIFEAASAAEPRPRPNHDKEWNTPSWSPQPRTEAAQGLLALLRRRPDCETAKSLLAELAKDPVPCIRFLVAIELASLGKHIPTFVAELLAARTRSETQPVVLDGLCRALSQNLNVASTRELVRHLVDKIDPEAVQDYHSDLVSMIVDLALRKVDEWPAVALSQWTDSPGRYCHLLSSATRRLLDYARHWDHQDQLGAAMALLGQVVDACIGFLLRTSREQEEDITPEARKHFMTIYKILDDIIMHLRLSLDSEMQGRRNAPVPSRDDLRRLFPVFRPILEKIANYGSVPPGGLHASTAHHFMELLHSVLSIYPSDVLAFAAKVVEGGKEGNYQFDSLAVREIVSIIEELLADHRDVLRDETSFAYLQSILDAFASAGSPDALKLVWRLDEVYR